MFINHTKKSSKFHKNRISMGSSKYTEKEILLFIVKVLHAQYTTFLI